MLDRNTKIINEELGNIKTADSQECSEIFRLEILQYLLLKGTSSLESYEAVIFHGYVDQIEENLLSDLQRSQSLLRSEDLGSRN